MAKERRVIKGDKGKEKGDKGKKSEKGSLRNPTKPPSSSWVLWMDSPF